MSLLNYDNKAWLMKTLICKIIRTRVDRALIGKVENCRAKFWRKKLKHCEEGKLHENFPMNAF